MNKQFYIAKHYMTGKWFLMFADDAGVEVIGTLGGYASLDEAELAYGRLCELLTTAADDPRRRLQT